MAKYKVLVGKYVDDDPVRKDSTGGSIDKMYQPGDVIETDKDLLKHNTPGAPPKFSRLDIDVSYLPSTSNIWDASKETLEQFVTRMKGNPLESNPPESTNLVFGAAKAGVDSLNHMTINELRKYAEEEEIDLKNTTKKEEMIKIILATVTSSSR